jgi:predicted AlkP superfamily phosphohydrolase/phosphomutase
VLLVRLDTEPFVLALYVGGHALLGALFGAVVRARWNAYARALCVTAMLFAFDALGLGRLWQHRGLPLSTGLLLLGGGAVLALAVAWSAGLFIARLPRRVPRLLAGGGMIVCVLGIVLTTVLAARGPARPPGAFVDDPTRDDTGVRVAILGLDGLDGLIVDEAIAEGRMPNLAALIRRGVRGDLRSIRPPKSPVVWTSVATGMLPERHGITDFVVRREGERVPVTSNLRRVPALWNIALPAGFTCAFVNWYVTWPAETTRGVIVSDRADFAGLDHRVFPEELTSVVDSVRAGVDGLSDRDIGRFTDVDGSFPEWRGERWGQVRRAMRILDDVVRHDLVTLETGRAVLARSQPDLTALYFRGNDNTQHLFWKYRVASRGEFLADALYPRIPVEDVTALSPVVDRYYDFIDRIVGECVAMMDEDTAILVLSDHGFLTNNERSRWYHANRILEAEGLATLEPGAGGIADPAASLVYDPEGPSVAARRLLRAGGRTSDPIAALEEARRRLEGLRTDAGDSVFRSLAVGEDEHGPRLAVVFAGELEGSTVSMGGSELGVDEFRVPEGHSGDHRMNGFLLAAGGPFRTGTVEGARAVDIGPTVLHLLGAPAPADAEGAVLTDLLRDDWNRAHPVRYVETYGDLAETGSEDVIASDADARIREELEALGYLR